ncbi:hypothetical protein [Acetobacter nitrogenifigens]|nr:hypothetical protein [Acetobacter nitrogenifigens]
MSFDSQILHIPALKISSGSGRFLIFPVVQLVGGNIFPLSGADGV